MSFIHHFYKEEMKIAWNDIKNLGCERHQRKKNHATNCQDSYKFWDMIFHSIHISLTEMKRNKGMEIRIERNRSWDMGFLID
jgi:hypothetical protein